MGSSGSVSDHKKCLDALLFNHSMVANGTTNGTQTYSNRQSETLGLSHTEWIEIQVSVCSLTISSGNWSIPAYALRKYRRTILTSGSSSATQLRASVMWFWCVRTSVRRAFPFDVQHRKIIQYSTESTSDFETARSKITEQLKAVLIKRKNLDQLGSVTSVSKVKGLEQYEIAGLVAVAEEVYDPEAGISPYVFRKNMERAGFSNLAGTLALKSLLDRGMLERLEETEIKVTSKGMSWLLTNQERLTLQIAAVEPQGLTDDDVPF